MVGGAPWQADAERGRRRHARCGRQEPVVSFESTAAKQRFTNAIIAALQLARPELFQRAERDGWDGRSDEVRP